ncbi:adenosylcobinamide kinase [Actibacterium mucosum KCTC 23349]|uniref:Bifunctional adenosylcobalamin biosynthesis protein n=1 Tax=Actibacterium mucosum KCTC 23349 TaxID=1454373 RepID=A0A037ZK21_9RHOB|nr:bifunctional adenosylcobinamide kinase/adenosylcobinamide-phosphate guanylyltransferase [Actibacterium mucosum]KAJ55191.1 adenosylcobinamide kinase [Actibacterium mucosum KCTC 23349]
MGKSILVTGGARSGKSAIAERLTLQFGGPVAYIATAQAWDDEMAERIAEHQARRGPEWRTVNAPLDVVGALWRTDGVPRLLDCLTMWLSNLIHDERDWRAEGAALVAALAEQSAPVVLVTNEVGGGIVPENALAREFRDAAGVLNQMVAAQCDTLYLAVAGHPLKVKPNDDFAI